MNWYKYIVVGTGHGGTKYMSKLLTAMGTNCSHEWVFGFGSWNPNGFQGDLTPAESSWLAAPLVRTHRLLYRAHMIHATRHPLKVVRSTLNGTHADPFYTWREMWTGQDRERRSDILYHMEQYVKWHKIIERQRGGLYTRLRVEDAIPALEALGMEQIAPLPSSDTNKHVIKPIPDLTWEELPKGKIYDQLRKLGEYYGYE